MSFVENNEFRNKDTAENYEHELKYVNRPGSCLSMREFVETCQLETHLYPSLFIPGDREDPTVKMRMCLAARNEEIHPTKILHHRNLQEVDFFNSMTCLSERARKNRPLEVKFGRDEVTNCKTVSAEVTRTYWMGFPSEH